MNKTIKFELAYIPKGPRGSIQNQLRFFYSAYRRKGIVEGEQREEALRRAIDKLTEKYPDFNPMFDESFFKISKKNFFQKIVDHIRR